MTKPRTRLRTNVLLIAIPFLRSGHAFRARPSSSTGMTDGDVRASDVAGRGDHRLHAVGGEEPFDFVANLWIAENVAAHPPMKDGLGVLGNDDAGGDLGGGLVVWPVESDGADGKPAVPLVQHFFAQQKLYFSPLPHGHGS